jgi:hypothetical protein
MKQLMFASVQYRAACFEKVRCCGSASLYRKVEILFLNIEMRSKLGKTIELSE